MVFHNATELLPLIGITATDIPVPHIRVPPAVETPDTVKDVFLRESVLESGLS